MRPFESHCSAHNGQAAHFCNNGFAQNDGCLNRAIKNCNCGTVLSTTPNCLLDEPKARNVVDFRKVRAAQLKPK